MSSLILQNILFIKPNTGHPAWANWAWAHEWLPEAFHLGGDKPIWEWLKSRPYVPHSLSSGPSDSLSVDGIVLSIECLLHDIEALQFTGEFHPPQYVAQSQVNFNTISSLIHPTLDSLLEVIQDHNNLVSEKNTLKAVELTALLPRPPPMMA